MKPHANTLVRFVTFGTLLALGAACTAQPAALPAPSNSANTTDDSPTDPPPAATTPPAATAAPVTTGVTLTSVAPSSVSAGANPSGLTVTLTGTNFVSGAQVTLNGSALAATVTSPTTMTAVLPPAPLSVAGALALAVMSGTTSSNAVTLTVVNGPVGTTTGGLISLNPSSAPLASQFSSPVALTVSGSSFDSTSVIVFNGTDIQTQFLNTSALEGAIPPQLLAQPGTAEVAVRHAGILTAPLPFTIGDGFGTGTGQCQTTCSSLGLQPGQCSQVGGIDIGFGPINLGGLFGQDVQCGFDGCVTQGCN